MILVTGAAGKTGRAILRRLAARGAPARAFVHREEQRAAARECGAAEALAGDLTSPEGVRAAAAGAAAIYHICPNMSRDEEAIGDLVIAAARHAGARLVYHSVVEPRVEAMPHHWRKARVEDAVRASGLAHSILRPAAYLQNLLQHRAAIVERGVLPVPYAAETRVVMVDLDDVAEAAARVLTEPGHDGAVYELCAPELLDQREIAATLSRVLGRRVEIEVVPRTIWAEDARRSGLADRVIADLLRMFERYERHGMRADPAALARLLGRPATSLEEFARRRLAP